MRRPMLKYPLTCSIKTQTNNILPLPLTRKNTPSPLIGCGIKANENDLANGVAVAWSISHH